MTTCADHTPQPLGYLEWHQWADRMVRDHIQERCDECQLFKIWTKVRLSRQGPGVYRVMVRDIEIGVVERDGKIWRAWHALQMPHYRRREAVASVVLAWQQRLDPETEPPA